MHQLADEQALRTPAPERSYVQKKDGTGVTRGHYRKRYVLNLANRVYLTQCLQAPLGRPGLQERRAEAAWPTRGCRGHRAGRSSRKRRLDGPGVAETSPRLTVNPTCYPPPALAIQTWGSGQRGHLRAGAAQGGSVYGGLCGRASGARVVADAERGVAGGWVVFFNPTLYSVSHLLFALFVSVTAEAVAAVVATAAGPAPSRRALSLQQGALRVAVARAEARPVRCVAHFNTAGGA